jgi:hypothetical protein
MAVLAPCPTSLIWLATGEPAPTRGALRATETSAERALVQSVPARSWCRLPLRAPPTHESHTASTTKCSPHVIASCLCRRALDLAPVRVVRRRAIPIPSLVEMGSTRLPPRTTRLCCLCVAVRASRGSCTSIKLVRHIVHIK